MDEYTGDQTPSSIWLRYSLTRTITPKLRRQFLEHFPDLDVLHSVLKASKPVLDTCDSIFNEKASIALRAQGTASVTKEVQAALLWEQDAPPILYVSGNIKCLNTPCVAMVGARKATHGALEQARYIAQSLAQNGITVVSGLALGIDAAAHQGAMHGNGETIAVSATSPERVYPQTHCELAKKIESNGAIVTEFPLKTSLQAHCFPRRNRIISGMSIGVLVVEAALPSGTLTTAQHALRQGREVMAMPGSVQNPMTRGCHELLKNGAALIENAEDVIACLHNELERHLLDSVSPEQTRQETKIHNKLANVPPDTLTLLNCLGFDPVSIDTLVARSGLTAARVAGALTHLELAGVIVADQGGRYIRCKQSGTQPGGITRK